jgi:hypothetical protein
MPQKKSKNTKPSAPKSKPVSAKKTRRLHLGKYKSFRLQKRIKPEVIQRKPMLSARKIFVQSYKILFKNWKLFGGILLIYLVLNIILIGGLNGGDLQNMKNSVSDLFTGSAGKISGGFALFAVLLTSANSGNGGDGSTYQALLLFVVCLATVWALRQRHADHKIRIRDAFYQGMYPLIPVLLVLIAICLQLIPFLIGSLLYNLLVSGGIAAFTVEKLIAGTIFFLLGVLSLYMLLSSIWALYIVTLPDMTPMKALRSARELVRYRRLKVLRKVAFLPFALIILLAIVIVPLIIVSAPVAAWAFFVLSAAAVLFVLSYLYSLYRELIS